MEKTAQMEFLKNQKMSNDFLKQMPRRWEAGDVYSPHDLSPYEMTKFRRWPTRNEDVVDMLGIRPEDMYKVWKRNTAFAFGFSRGSSLVLLLR